MLKERAYNSLYGDRVWVVRGKDLMLVELQKFSIVKGLGLTFTGMPIEVHTTRSDYRHGLIIMRAHEISKVLQRTDNRKVAKKLENFFRQHAGVR